MASCKECLFELPGSTSLQKMYHNKAERCPFFKNKADFAEVKHGKWVDRYSEKYDNHMYECSECRKKALYDARGDELGNVKITQVLSPVCPWCGAKMDE